MSADARVRSRHAHKKRLRTPALPVKVPALRPPIHPPVEGSWIRDPGERLGSDPTL